MSKASNCVLALSRAYYGKRLTEKQYGEMLACKDINELASYLRSRTVYAEGFAKASSDDMSAEGVASCVQRYKYIKYSSLCRFERAIGNDFYRYFIVKTEVEQILNCTLHMLGGKTREYLLNVDDFIDLNLDIDLYKLGRANSLEEIAHVLKKTQYEKLYAKCLHDADRTYLTFELAFDDYLKKYEDELVKKCFKGKERKDMNEMLSRMFDKQYIGELLRIVDYYSGIFAVSNLVLPYSVSYSLFSESQIKSLTKAQTVEQIFEVLLKSPYKKCVGGGNEKGEIEKRFYLDFYRYCKKQIRFSSYPGVVLFCYLFLAENEIRNITRIAQGIKYKIPTDEIRNSLIGVGD